MKLRTTVILLCVFAVLLGFVLFFESKTKGKKEAEEKLVDLASEDVKKISLKKEDETLVFEKDEKGDWLIKEPIEARADNYEVNRLAQDFSSLKMERVVEKEAQDLAKYEIPKKELTLWFKDREQPVKLLIGMENPLDHSLFAKREDDTRIVLLASYLKSSLDKTVFDFRQKDIFKFESGDVSRIFCQAKDVVWEAGKKEDQWFLEKPVAALARKNYVEDILRSLAGLRAKAFLSEQKQTADLEKYGLINPEYRVKVNLLSQNQELTFFLHKEGDKLYATTSASPKIVEAETYLLTDLDKKIEEIREKKVVDFYSWEAKKAQFKKGDFLLIAAKDKDDKWWLETPEKKEADSSRVETFIRKIGSLEATEFIDSPQSLADYGLDPAQVEITITTEDKEKPSIFEVHIGREDAEKKQVVVRNPHLSYLFLVDSSFLSELPKEAKDWLPPPPEEKKQEKKEEK